MYSSSLVYLNAPFANMAGLLFGFGPVERRSDSSVIANPSIRCSCTSQRFARASVGLGVQQTHDCDRLPRGCFFLEQKHSCTLVGVLRKASLVADISQLLSHSQTHCIVVLGSVWLVSRGWSEASRAEGWEGGGEKVSCFFTCTHCHVDIRCDQFSRHP